jgi:hypothetical protein
MTTPDPLAPKRERLAALMSTALAPKVFNASDGDIASLPETVLIELIETFEARSKGPFVSGF